ncbi:MAG TPA: murein biosynthesis integral membrane protein MurJ [Opitutaceae bacterium]|nr:murein biosynthesis integral membrane protein MurJ [Opitutaceae bacterium]
MSKHLKNIGVVSLLTVFSRVTGLIRDQLTAAIFGAGGLNDAFFTAFSLPNLFRRLLGEGALTAAFVPLLQQELHEKGSAGAFALLSKVVSRLAVVTFSLVALAMFLLSRAGPLRGWAGHGEAAGPVLRFFFETHDKWDLLADLTVILFPYLALVCVAAAFNATLNVLGHFLEPALSPIWLNLVMIGSLAGAGLHFASTPLGQLHWLCAGVLLGGFFQMAVPAVVLVRMGWRPRLDLAPSPQVSEILRLMAPGLFGTGIYQVNIVVSRLLAFSLPVSAATTLFLANRLMELPIGVFAIAVSTVVYPLIAQHAVGRKFAEMAADYRKGMRLILVINVPAAVGLAVLSQPIVRLLYRHGNFTPEAAHDMSLLLTLFAVGMPFFSVVNLTVRAFYALKDTATPVRVATVDFVANVVLSLLLRKWLGAPGLVLASTTAILIQMILLQRALLRRLPEMTLAPLVPSLAKVLAGATAMGALVWACWQFVRGQDAVIHLLGVQLHVADLYAVFLLIPLGVLVYGVTLWFLKIEGRDDLAALARRLRTRLVGRKEEAGR